MCPSRASLLTGRTQGHSEVRDNQFDKALEDNYTIGNTLQKIGYTTIAIGKWGLQGTDANWSSHPLKRGFDEYYGYIRHSDGHEHYPKEGKYRGKKEVYDNYSNVAEDLDKSYTGICGQPVQNTGLPNTIRIKRQTILHVPCL